MALKGRLELDNSDFNVKLADSVKRSNQAGRQMASGFDKGAQSITKIAGPLDGVTSRFGALGGLGSIISGLANPISAVFAGISAGVAGLIGYGKQLWDELTLSAEEYAIKAERALKRAGKEASDMAKSQERDLGDLDQLRGLAGKERLTRTERLDAVNLIGKLRIAYGELGLSIDQVTGKISGMDRAEETILKRQQQRLTGARTRELRGLNRNLDAQLKVIEDDYGNYGRPQTEFWRQAVESGDTEGAIRQLEEALETATARKDIENLIKLIDGLEARRAKELEISELVNQDGEAEARRRRQRRTAEGLDQADAARDKALDQLRDKRDASRYAGAGPEERLAIREAEIAAELEKQRDLERQIGELQERRSDSELERRQNQARVLELYVQIEDSLLRQQKLEAEADALRRAAEEDHQRRLAERQKFLQGQLRELSTVDLSRFGAVQQNNLTDRGGWLGGATAPDAQEFNRSVTGNLSSIVAILRELETLNREAWCT